jgi:signal transduction histidine kinase
LTLAPPATAQGRLVRFCLVPACAAAAVAAAGESHPLGVLLSALLAAAAGLLAYPAVAPRRPLPWTLLAGALLWPATRAGEVSTAVLLLLPLALIAMAWRSRARGALLADEIARIPMVTGTQVRDGLRRAIGDESLEVFFRMPDHVVFVNGWGEERDGGQAGRGRHVIGIDDPSEPAGAGPVAMIEVDDRFGRRPPAERLRAVTLLSSRDLAMARLDTVTKVGNRRARAGDLAQRRELEQVLHEQVQQRVSAISMTLGRLGLRTASDSAAAASVHLAQEELSVALVQLRSIAEALYSPLLRESGLASALEQLGRSVDLPVGVTVADEDGLDDTMRAAALTAAQDIVGDAAATLDGIRDRPPAPPGLHIDVSATERIVVVRVTADRADLVAAGSRIRLLSARVEEAGGGIQLESRPGPGSVMTVRIPCG